MNLSITLPWPPAGLSPNARLHWSKTARLKKDYRKACGWEAIAQGIRKIEADALVVHLTFYPPDRRHYDQDNLVARMKAGLDGLSDAIGVDDKHFKLSHDLATEIGGMVKVRISKGAD